MAWFAIVASVVSAIGQLNQANRQAKQLEYNAVINENNARLYQAQAAEQERKQRQHLASVLAGQRVAVGKSGITMAGTPLLVAEDMNSQGELDALTIRYNGEMRANNERYQAAVNRWQASSTKNSAMLSAFGTVLGGIGQYSQMTAMSSVAGLGISSTGGSVGLTSSSQLYVPSSAAMQTFKMYDPSGY